MFEQYVYVVGSGRSGEPVKIGWSVQPEERVKQLQIGSPCILRLLDQHPGPPELEDFLHDRFASLWIHGEWFNFGNEDPLPLISEAVTAWGATTDWVPYRAAQEAGACVNAGSTPSRAALFRERLQALESPLKRQIVTVCKRKGGNERGVPLWPHDIKRGPGAPSEARFPMHLQELVDDGWLDRVPSRMRGVEHFCLGRKALGRD